MEEEGRWREAEGLGVPEREKAPSDYDHSFLIESIFHPGTLD